MKAPYPQSFTSDMIPEEEIKQVSNLFPFLLHDHSMDAQEE